MNVQETLSIDLGDRSYPILIGSSWGSLSEKLVEWTGDDVVLITNPSVAALYLDPILKTLCSKSVNVISIGDGEQYKNLTTFESVVSQMLSLGIKRSSTLIALGGGVVGDLAGFVAACYQRGISYLQVPTTLLAQVDSSVGGKTAVNHELGKNMIGAFYQPKAVLVNVETLDTLPDRELRAGLAEVIKYGLIMDEAFYRWCCGNMDTLLARDKPALVHAIKQACQCKAHVVARDERESGVRAILNLGHTFGHAIEGYTRYESWLHGEAVAVGTLMALDMSSRLGWVVPRVVDDYRDLLIKMNLPIEAPPGISVDDFIGFMAKDKKNVDSSIRLVLLRAVGRAEVTSDYPWDALLDVLEAFAGS